MTKFLRIERDARRIGQRRPTVEPAIRRHVRVTTPVGPTELDRRRQGLARGSAWQLRRSVVAARTQAIARPGRWSPAPVLGAPLVALALGAVLLALSVLLARFGSGGGADAWQSLEMPGSFLVSTGSLDALVADEVGFVALAGGEDSATLWRSVNGASWQGTSSSALGGVPLAVASDGLVTVVVGRARFVPDEDGPGFWRVLGSTWTRGTEIAPAGTPRATSVDAVVRAGFGFIAAGLAPNPVDRTLSLAVWRSVDGLRWQRLTDPAFDRVEGGRILLAMRPDGRVLVSVGQWLIEGTPGSTKRRTAGVWANEQSAGAPDFSWSTIALIGPSSADAPRGLAASSSQLVVAGCAGEKAPPTVWVPSAGLPQAIRLASGSGCVRSVVYADGRFRAVGDLDGRGVVWTSSEGTTWSLLGPAVERTTTITSVAVGPHGDLLVVGRGEQVLPVFPGTHSLFGYRPGLGPESEPSPGPTPAWR